MSSLPGIVTHRKPKRMALNDAQQSALIKGGPVVIESGQVDAGNTAYRTTVLRPGNVITKKTGSTKFVVVDDYANVDQGTVAAVTSAIAPDVTWQSVVLTIFRNGVKVYTVTAGAADDTLAEFLTLLNTTTPMPELIAADDGGGKLKITDEIGNGDAIRVEASLATAYGTAGGAGSYAEDEGTVPDVRVILEEVDMLSAAGSAQDGFCSENAWSGSFRVGDLIRGKSGAAGIPASAKAILKARGSQFDS